MKGLHEINRRADGLRTDAVRQHRRDVIAWLTRAREKLEQGDYEGCKGALRGANLAVDALLPVPARDAA